MKKATSASQGSTTKLTPTAIDVDKYLEGVPEPARTTLSKVRAMIRSVVPPEATETISNGMPAMNSSLIKAYQDELRHFKTSKGTIQFAMDKPLSAALVKKLVKARIAENELKRG
jgi:uncharacterized protein YdhG (YjbR/CyaY superfamily)